MNIQNKISMIDTQIAIELGWANYFGHFNDSNGASGHLYAAKRLMLEKENLILEMENQERADEVNREYEKTSRY
jgi:hypothetical protein